MKRLIIILSFLILCFTVSAQIQPVDVTGPTYDTPNQAFTKVNANDAYLDTLGVQRLDSLIDVGFDYWKTSGTTTLTGVTTIEGDGNDVGIQNGNSLLYLGADDFYLQYTGLNHNVNLVEASLTGNWTAATQAGGDNSTRIATTEFVTTAIAAGVGGITNGAGANELMKSDGTNAVASGIFSTSAGDIQMGTGLAGTSRTITAAGSASNVNLILESKGTSMIRLDATTNIQNETPVFSILGTSATTNTVHHPIEITNYTSGTAAVGIGVGITLSSKNSIGSYQAGTLLESVATDVTNESEDFDFVVRNIAGGAPAAEVFRLKSVGNIVVPTTITAASTTGDRTINKISGTVNFAAAATSITVTNSLVSANSLVFAVVRTNDATAVIKNVVPAPGSFTITLDAAATAETSVGFFVVN